MHQQATAFQLIQGNTDDRISTDGTGGGGDDDVKEYYLELFAELAAARGFLVPASVKGTAKPAVRAKLPPLVIGRTTGTFVIRLKASGDTISTERRPFCSWPDVGSRLTSQISPRFIGRSTARSILRCIR